MAAGSVETADGKFNIRVVHDIVSEAVIGDDDVHIGKYIQAYRELYKFFELLGSVFSFVGSDVKDKLKILEELKAADKDNKFHSIESMMLYEQESGLLNKNGYVSGCRTLLRLHRGLDFICLFLQNVSELKDEDKCTTVCQESYALSLAKYHPWIIRKSAEVAMYTLPTREVLLQKVCGTKEDVRKSLDVLPKMLIAAREVYDRTENLYTKHNLHELP